MSLLDRHVRESLAGRASYFFLHTLSVAELGDGASLADWFIRGRFPELYARPELDPSRYLDDYVRTFVEWTPSRPASCTGRERSAALRVIDASPHSPPRRAAG